MFINEYDILLDKIFDNIYDNVEILKINKINLEKQLRNSNDYIKDISKLTKDNDLLNELLDITKNIIYAYFICLSFLNDKSINEIKTILIKSKILDSENLGDITSIYYEIEILIEILNEENNEKLVDLYKINEKYKFGIDLLNNFGYENTMTNLKGNKKVHKHNLVKYIIILRYYRKKYRKKIFDLIYFDKKKKHYIEVVIPKLKVIDYSNIANILSSDDIKKGFANEILNFYEEYEKSVFTNFDIEIQRKINLLFNSKIVIPITDEFLRFHKITDKYEKVSNKDKNQIIKDQTKIRFIVTKLEKIKDLYSKKIKNNKDLLNEVDKMFYRPLNYRKAVIYNEIEELSIINKLLLSGKKAIDSNEFYFDLKNLRKSSYINFNNFKNEGFQHLIDKSCVAVRYSGIESLETKQLANKNIIIDTRTISGSSLANIVGLFILENNKNVHEIKYKDLINVRNINENGFKSTKRILLDKLTLKNKNSYYWIFDSKKDFFEQSSFEIDSNKNDEYNKLIVSKIYDFCLNECYNKIMAKLSKFDKIDLYYSFNISKYHQNNLLKFNKSSEFIKLINKKIYDIIPKNNDMFDEKENTIYGMIGNIQKLPVDNRVEKEIKIINIPYLENKEIINLEEENSYCQHILDWNEITRLRSKSPNKHSELLYNFIKKYVMTNSDNEYICKSCKQFVDIQNFLSNPYDGVSSNIELALSTYKNLSDIKEYSKFSILIKNIDKYVERIAQINNFSLYLGNEQIHKIRRQDITKQVIDIIVLHDKTLRTKNMDKRTRELNAFRNYGISSDFTFFFIFPLTNDIFKSSSKELDKFKKFKINNIIVYILLFMILDLNESQVMMFDYNKICNYILFDRLKKILFEKLMIKTDTSEKNIPVLYLDVFCYILYYCSCMISKYNLWYIINLEKNNTISFKQKSIIHTFMDMINSLLETFSTNNNFIYEMLGSKIIGKINTLFRNKEILNIIKKKEEKKVVINNNKILIKKSIIESIYLKKEMTKYKSNIKNINEKGIYYYSKLKMPVRNVNEIIGKEMSNIVKNFDLQNKIKLAQIYDKNGILRRFKLSYEEASKLDNKLLDIIISNINKNKDIFFKKIEKKNILVDEKNKFLNLKFDNKLDNLLKEIRNIDNEIILDGIVYNVYDSKLNINYDYLGNPINKKFYLKIKDNKVSIFFDKDLNLNIYEIIDESNDIRLIFDKFNLHYLGYKIKSGKFKNLENLNIYAKYIPSIKEMFETIGFKKNYYNFEDKKGIENEIRNSISNLKEYIGTYKIYLNKLKNKNINDSNKIIKSYLSKIDNLKLKKDNINIFSNNDIIKLQNTSIKDINKLKNLSKIDLINLTNSYYKLNNYLTNEILNLLQINDIKNIKANLIYFILTLTKLFYYENFNQYDDFDLIRYKQLIKQVDLDLLEEIRDNKLGDVKDEVLYKDDEFINENTEEQKYEMEQQLIDNEEMLDALDIDDNDIDPEDGDGEVMFYDEDN